MRSNIRITVIFFFLSIFTLFFSSCEMKQETDIHPIITINYPTNDQTIMHGSEINITAQLIGFSGYKRIDSVMLEIDDSVVYACNKKQETINYLWKTATYTIADHKINIQVTYQDNTPDNKEWNYFGARDFIEEQMNQKTDTLSVLEINKNINVKITPQIQGSPNLQFVTLDPNPFNYDGKTIILDSFRISKYEVTNAQYTKFLNDIEADPDGSFENMKYLYLSETSNITYDSSKFITKTGKDSLPVTNVTWLGAQNYCLWAGGRLPTQAEFYYATAHESINTPGYMLGDIAWYKSNSNGTIHKIGTKAANPLGIYDIIGNASEWCFDWFTTTAFPMPGDTLINPVVQGSHLKMIKGGNWNSLAYQTNVAIRNPMNPSSSSNFIGFRVAKTIKN